MDVKTYCRICQGICGMVATVEDNKVVAVRGDQDHPLTRGYACIKGLQNPELLHGPGRIRRPLARQSDGSHAPIASQDALDRIALKIADIVRDHGPNSVALFTGTQTYFNPLHLHFSRAFFRALGSRSMFSPATIDQSAKMIVLGRLGSFASGQQPFHTSDVWLLAGTNPLVSLQGGVFGGFPIYNPTKSLRDAKARGMKIIVVDPRRTETALQADIHLQLRPGEDASLFAGLIHVILREGWHDAEFCARYVASDVGGIEAMRQAVAPFTPEYVAARADVPAQQIVAAAEMFAHTARTGMAGSGTGTDMGPWSNLSEHLLECLNVLCGRYLREGAKIANPGVMGARRPVHAEVRGPNREWERGPASRVAPHAAGLLMGEMPSGTLADEILTPGEGQIRALISSGSNPGACVPDQLKVVRALKSLDLLVAVDPRYSETARLADYVIAPTLGFERPDNTRGHEPSMPFTFAQYTPPVVKPDADSDVMDDWRFYWELARRLGLSLSMSGRPIDMEHAPATEDLLAQLSVRGAVPYDEVKARPGGAIFDLPEVTVQPPRPEATDRFCLMPDDVAAELAEVFGESDGHSNRADPRFPYRLTVRRHRETMNSLGKDLGGIRARMTFNPAFIHPEDLAAHGLAEGDAVEITSADGSIPARVKADATLRRGVVSMSHSWGALPGEDEDYQRIGASTSRLLGPGQRSEAINAMPQMTAIPVAIRRAG